MSTNGWSTDTWYHMAIVRHDDTLDIYRDGISIADTVDSDTLSDLSADVFIGMNPVGVYPYSLDGYLDDFRITKGVARWTENFSGNLP